MDALAHNLEAFCAPGYHPMADGIALEGMKLISKWLPEAYKNGSNLEARMNMLTAASMGSTAVEPMLAAVSMFILASRLDPFLYASGNHLEINFIPSKAIPSAIG